MKVKYNIFIGLGLILFCSVIVLSALSEGIDERIKTTGFFIIGYLSVIIFTYGWLKRSAEKKNNKEQEK